MRNPVHRGRVFLFDFDGILKRVYLRALACPEKRFQMKKFYLRRGSAIKEIPEHLIEPNIKKGKIRSSDELSTDKENWTQLSHHPSFHSLFTKTRVPSRSIQKDTISTSTKPQHEIAEDLPFPKPGFFQRIFALLIDSVILFIIGAILGISLESFWVGLEGWGGYVGFIILLGYYGTLNSKVRNGQTVGKEIVSIRVVGKDGNPLPIGTSFLRSTILLLPFTLEWLMRPLESEQMALAKFIDILNSGIPFITTGAALAIIYLYVFNQKTRQSLHDVIAGTYVIRVDSKLGPNLEPLKRIHLCMVTTIFILVFIIPYVLIGYLGISLINILEVESQSLKSTVQDLHNLQTSSDDTQNLKILQLLHDKLGGSEDYKKVLITIERSSLGSELKIEAMLKQEPDSILSTLNQLKEVVKSLGPYPKDINSINLVVRYWYDIGIYGDYDSASIKYPNT